MENEELQNLIANEVKKQLKIEKKKLANIIRTKLEYTGEFAKCHYIMRAFDSWEIQ